MLRAISKRFNGISSTIEITPIGFQLHMEGSKPLTFPTFIGAVSYDKRRRSHILRRQSCA